MPGNVRQTIVLNASSIAANGNATSSAFTLNDSALEQIAISAQVTYGSASAAGVTFNVYAAWSDPTVGNGALQWDSDIFTQFSVSNAANSTKQKTQLINVAGVAAIRIQAVNNDGTNATGQVYVVVREIYSQHV